MSNKVIYSYLIYMCKVITDSIAHLQRYVWAVWCIEKTKVSTTRCYFTQSFITDTRTVWHV